MDYPALLNAVEIEPVPLTKRLDLSRAAEIALFFTAVPAA
jgi:hypothetical protein